MRKIKKCIKCRKLKQHGGLGLCINCYANYRYKEIIKKDKKKYKLLQENRKRCDTSITRILYKNSRRRASRLIDKSKCIFCNSKNNIQVHHKDFNVFNNNIENLITLCKKCHGNIHNRLSI